MMSFKTVCCVYLLGLTNALLCSQTGCIDSAFPTLTSHFPIGNVCRNAGFMSATGSCGGPNGCVTTCGNPSSTKCQDYGIDWMCPTGCEKAIDIIDQTVSLPACVEVLTAMPTSVPTREPTEVPTLTPTPMPTKMPTSMPSSMPTDTPTRKATEAPTPTPTQEPTETPTWMPTPTPTHKPTEIPTFVPTLIPTSTPTTKPTETPTLTPTQRPTAT